MKKRKLTVICIITFLVGGSFIFRSEITQAQKDRDVRKPTPTPAKTVKPTPTPQPSQSPTLTDTNTTTTKQPRKIIVVLDFDDVSLGSQKMQIGKQVGILLVNEFSKNGTYKVIERQRLAQILREQDLTFDERFDQDTAATVGKALSANPVVIGTITEYTIKKSGISVMGIGKITVTAKLGLAIRLVDVNTGEIVNSVTVEETASVSGVNAGVYQNDTIVDEDLRISLFTQAAGKAVTSAVQKLTPLIDNAPNFIQSQTNNPTTTTVNPSTSTNSTKPTTTQSQTISMAKVAEVVGTTVYITGLGKDVKVGDLLSVIRGKEIKNPDTGEVIDFDGNEIAKVEVFEVRENTVKAKIIKGTGVKIKDFVRVIK